MEGLTKSRKNLLQDSCSQDCDMNLEWSGSAVHWTVMFGSCSHTASLILQFKWSLSLIFHSSFHLL
jgi:hypothetical protein